MWSLSQDVHEEEIDLPRTMGVPERMWSGKRRFRRRRRENAHEDGEDAQTTENRRLKILFHEACRSGRHGAKTRPGDRSAQQAAWYTAGVTLCWLLLCLLPTKGMVVLPGEGNHILHSSQETAGFEAFEDSLWFRRSNPLFLPESEIGFPRIWSRVFRRRRTKFARNGMPRVPAARLGDG